MVPSHRSFPAHTCTVRSNTRVRLSRRGYLSLWGEMHLNEAPGTGESRPTMFLPPVSSYPGCNRCPLYTAIQRPSAREASPRPKTPFKLVSTNVQKSLIASALKLGAVDSTICPPPHPLTHPPTRIHPPKAPTRKLPTEPPQQEQETVLMHAKISHQPRRNLP